MTELDGLNLPQLLERMHGIVSPEPVAWTPQTAGWWVVLGWLATIVVLAVWQIYAHRRRNRYRREALAVLASIEAALQDDPASAACQIAVLLKRTAIAVYPRQAVAQLHGSEWARFLCQSAANDPGITQAAEQLAAAAYRTDVDAGALIAPARRWIKVHRA